MADLLSSWNRAWSRLSALGSGEHAYLELVRRYSELHRHYHTMQHLEECLLAFERAQQFAEHPAEVEMALWFHDAIYDVKRSDNEEQSAKLAGAVLSGHGVPAAVVERVKSLVLITRHSVLPATQDEKVLVDIDLSILASEEVRFDEYERQIRLEYGFVPGWLFKRKRKAILRSFLARPSIYSVPELAAKWEGKARANLARVVGENAV